MSSSGFGVRLPHSPLVFWLLVSLYSRSAKRRGHMDESYDNTKSAKNTKIIQQSPVSQQTVQEEQNTVNAALIYVPTKK